MFPYCVYWYYVPNCKSEFVLSQEEFYILGDICISTAVRTSNIKRSFFQNTDLVAYILRRKNTMIIFSFSLLHIFLSFLFSNKMKLHFKNEITYVYRIIIRACIKQHANSTPVQAVQLKCLPLTRRTSGFRKIPSFGILNHLYFK